MRTLEERLSKVESLIYTLEEQLIDRERCIIEQEIMQELSYLKESCNGQCNKLLHRFGKYLVRTYNGGL